MKNFLKKIHPENGLFSGLGFFRVENGHFPGGIFFEAKIGELKPHPENDYFTSSGSLGWDFKSQTFASKNSNRKMAIFQAWDFSGLKMAILWNLLWKMAFFQV